MWSSLTDVDMKQDLLTMLGFTSAVGVLNKLHLTFTVSRTISHNKESLFRKL